jgi:hypothetical protein
MSRKTKTEIDSTQVTFLGDSCAHRVGNFDDKLKDVIDLEVSDGVVSIILRGSVHALS